MKKRVILIFLTLLFTILAFGKVDLYAETTYEGLAMEEKPLSVQASETEETNEELGKTPQEEIKEEAEIEKTEEETEKIKETENLEESKEQTNK